MTKAKYYFHIEAGNEKGYADNIDSTYGSPVNLHIKADSEKQAMEQAKLLVKRKYYKTYRVDHNGC